MPASCTSRLPCPAHSTQAGNGKGHFVPSDTVRALRTFGRRKRTLRLVVGAVTGPAAALLLSYCAFRLRFNLSTAGSIDLLVVVLTALRFGFWKATGSSLVAIGCLDYFFVAPILTFHVADPLQTLNSLFFDIMKSAKDPTEQRLFALRLLGPGELLIQFEVQFQDIYSRLTHESQLSTYSMLGHQSAQRIFVDRAGLGHAR